VIETEWPDWETLKSFSLFSLNIERRDTKSNHFIGLKADEEEDRYIERLAKVFGCCAATLKREFQDHEPLARKIYIEQKVSTQDAWREALRRTQEGRAALKANHPAISLLPVLAEFMTFGSSTSGVEQGFAKTLRTISPQQLAADHMVEENICKLAIDKGLERDADIAQTAIKFWAEAFGEPRKHNEGKSRIDKGITTRKRARPDGRKTEADFLRKRRDSVVVAAQGTSATDASNSIINGTCLHEAGGAWTDKHEKEQDFQKTKRARRMFLNRGELLDDELADPEVQEEMKQQQSNQDKRDKERLADTKRKELRTTGGGLGNMNGRSAFIDQDASSDELSANLLRKGANVVDQRCGAQTFVVRDPASTSTRIHVSARMTGAWICTSRLDAGPVVKYKAKLDIHKKVSLTTDFKNAQMAVANIIKRIATTFPGSKWKILEDVEQYRTLKNKAEVQKRPNDALGIGLDAE
ncbi:unnamed protein product, partial [Prorocentrum cordatum]